MPQVALAAIAAGVGAVLQGATLAAAMVSALVSGITAGIGMLLQPKPSTGTKGLETTVRQPTAYRQVAYGQRRLGGVVVFIDTRDSKNKWLDMAVAVAGHEIESFDEVWFGDDKIWDSGTGTIADYQDDTVFEFHTGTDSQAASPHLLANNSNWTVNHRLRGIAYAVVSLKWDSDLFPSGIPAMTFTIKGKKVYDPRDFTTGYSTNAALCIRDFLTDQRLGFGASSNEIDEASFIAGANLCDELVALAAGGDEPRYTCNGAFDVNVQFASVIESMLTSMGARITYTGGKFRLVNPSYTAPTLTLDETHIRGPINVQTRRSRRDAYNGVRGTFASATDNWVESDYPPVVSTAFSQADGEPLYRDLPLAFTTSASMAQRLAKVELLRGRQQIVAVVPMNLAAMELVPGDTVALTVERFGWTGKVFEVQSWAFAADSEGALGINVTLVETSSTLYDWTSSEEQEHLAGVPTNLPDGFSILAPGIVVSEEERTQNEDIFTVLIIDVSSSDQFAENFEVEFKLSSEALWRNAGKAATGRYEVVKVADGSAYDVRARVQSVTGVFSAYTQTSYTVSGSTTPPPDVTGLSAVAAGPHTTLYWTPVTDLRLSHYVIRHTSKVAGASWESATVIVPKVARPAASVTVSSRAGTYFVKAVDKLGRVSNNAASIVSPVSATEGLNVVQTITESPTYGGTHNSTEVVAGTLVLAGTINWDSLAGNWDDLVGNWDSLSLPYSASGTYEFTSVFDLGAVYTSRIFADLQFDATGGASAWDSQDGNWDDLDGNWDDIGGAVIPGLSASVEIATTSDDPGGSPTWSNWELLGANEYEARAFKFRSLLTSTDPDATPAVTTLAVTVDMPDRVVSEADLASGTDSGGLAVTFPGGAFRAVPAVGITAQNLVQGDFWEIVSKSVSGFTVRFKDSGSTVVNRTFDYQAKGYGRVI